MSTEKFRLERDKAAVVVVDIQERLMAAMKYAEKVYKNTNIIIEASKHLGLPVVVTEQYPRGLGHTVDEVKSCLSAYEPVEKITFSCCGEDSFMDAVKGTGRKQIILVGSETHVCVYQTCLDLIETGYNVHLVRDAVCSRAKENYLAALELMKEAGAVITTTETALFQMLVKAGGDEFKAISKLVK
jgi:nicotinamidase-related amidase